MQLFEDGSASPYDTLLDGTILLNVGNYIAESRPLADGPKHALRLMLEMINYKQIDAQTACTFLAEFISMGAGRFGVVDTRV